LQNRPAYILPVIVLSQFAGTSLWFVGNAVLPELRSALDLSQYAISLVTSAIMLGFIVGTLVFAFFSLPDRYSPVRLFFLSAIFGALANAAVAWWATDSLSLYILRFATGFFLAGIYPVGMKIAADWYEKGLGKALGFLVGALVLGTAFPHLLKNRQFDLPWKTVLYCTSLFAATGGILMVLFVGDGPFRKKSDAFQWNAFMQIFQSKKWRLAAFGYFGHMWELYSFWAFIPVMLGLYAQMNAVEINISLLSFLIIGSGSISCIAGGYLSGKFGSAKIAFACLLVSGICCFISPFIFNLPLAIFLSLLFIWGLTVVPDSPQFSTLVAQFAPENLRGTALTLYNSIGFLITTFSLLVMDRVIHSSGNLSGENSFILLGIGAVLGLPGMIKLIRMV
jgi:MFS family permease